MTNGTLVHRYADRLPQSIAYIDVSLDGPPSINDPVRGQGVFERATRNIELLIQAGFNVWISSVLHRGHLKRGLLADFLKTISSEVGCGRFYFSPVRNFTGALQPFLLSFDEIAELQETLSGLAETTDRIETVILDHPYEAVWRDYFWPIQDGRASCLDRLVIDGLGNVLESVSPHCYRKLDIFPHGPWATCRVDARGEYLTDVESRTFAFPVGVGAISQHALTDLFSQATRRFLRPMMGQFLNNMQGTRTTPSTGPALTTVSIPQPSPALGEIHEIHGS